MTIIDRRYSVAEGQAIKTPCAAATTANITLSGAQTIDGVAVTGTSPPTRVLVKDQSDTTLNGIYDVSTGNWTRTKDFDGAYDIVKGTAVYITDGTLGARHTYLVSTTGTIVIGTSAITFVQDRSTDAISSATAAAASQTAAAASAAAAAASAAAAVVSVAAAGAFPLNPGGRLTLTSGIPVLGTSVSAFTTVYYTPYAGNLVPIYDGSSMVLTSFSELSQATNDTTKSPAAMTTSSLYDIFVWNDSGTVRATRGPPWTNATSRSAGTALVMVKGIYLNNASITNGPAAQRGTYVGTVASNGSSTVDYIFGSIAAGGVAANFGVWNAYNRVTVGTTVQASTNTWTYNVASVWRAANSSATMRVTAVRGLDEDAIEASYNAVGQAGAAATAVCGVGLDTTTSYNGTTGATVVASLISLTARYSGLMGLGQHYVSANEYNDTTTASTWRGTVTSFPIQSGLHAMLRQ